MSFLPGSMLSQQGGSGGGLRREAALARLHELLHVYAELVASGEPAEQRYPGIAAHLHACGPCGEDFDGLLAAIGGRVD